MRKLIFLIFFAPLVAQGQLVTNILDCSTENKSQIPFKIQFIEKESILHLRNEKYILKFIEYKIDKNGYKWLIYKNQHITVSTQLPNKNFTSVFRNEYISSIDYTTIHPLTDGRCN
jgi:hypothetical protein